MKVEHIGGFKGLGIGNASAKVAYIQSAFNGKFVRIYYAGTNLRLVGISALLVLKPRIKPLTKEQWQARLKELSWKKNCS